MTDSTPFALKIGSFLTLSGKEQSVIRRLQTRRHIFMLGHDLVYQGQHERSAYILLSGWASSYKLQPDGGRQIVDIHVPGDFLGLRSILLHKSDHNVEPVADIEVAELGMEDLLEGFARMPRLSAAILWAASRDEAMVAERLVSLGRRTAIARVAHFMLELGERLALVGQGSDAGYDCPLTQYQLADALGLSAVHANRVLRQLRLKGMMTFRDGYVAFDDRDGLVDLAGFDPAYLDQVGPLQRKIISETGPVRMATSPAPQKQV